MRSVRGRRGSAHRAARDLVLCRRRGVAADFPAPARRARAARRRVRVVHGDRAAADRRRASLRDRRARRANVGKRHAPGAWSTACATWAWRPPSSSTRSTGTRCADPARPTCSSAARSRSGARSRRNGAAPCASTGSTGTRRSAKVRAELAELDALGDAADPAQRRTRAVAAAQLGRADAVRSADRRGGRRARRCGAGVARRRAAGAAGRRARDRVARTRDERRPAHDASAPHRRPPRSTGAAATASARSRTARACGAFYTEMEQRPKSAARSRARSRSRRTARGRASSRPCATRWTCPTSRERISRGACSSTSRSVRISSSACCGARPSTARPTTTSRA